MVSLFISRIRSIMDYCSEEPGVFGRCEEGGVGAEKVDETNRGCGQVGLRDEIDEAGIVFCCR